MSSPANLEYLVKVSYMEIYMERIRDLLARASSFVRAEEAADAVGEQPRTTISRSTRTRPRASTSRTFRTTTLGTRPRFTRSCGKEGVREPFRRPVRRLPTPLPSSNLANSPTRRHERRVLALSFHLRHHHRPAQHGDGNAEDRFALPRRFGREREDWQDGSDGTDARGGQEDQQEFECVGNGHQCFDGRESACSISPRSPARR